MMLVWRSSPAPTPTLTRDVVVKNNFPSPVLRTGFQLTSQRPCRGRKPRHTSPSSDGITPAS